MHPPLYIIAACDDKYGIGKNGTLPWRLKQEMKHFRDVTTITRDAAKRNMVIMGRTTWESLPEKFRPLPHRMNVVLTHDTTYEAKGALVVHSLNEALSAAQSDIETVFVIGGGQLYKQAIQHPSLTGVYLTKISGDFGCDTFFPALPASFRNPSVLGSNHEDGISFQFLLYKR